MPDGTSRFKCKGQDIKHFVSPTSVSSHFLPSLFSLPKPRHVEGDQETTR